MIDNHAPIVLFTYNRLFHTKKTVEALQKNELAKFTELYIYSDASRNEGSNESVNQVRDYIRTIKGFKNITIIERESNYGLAKSIIDGVSSIIEQYGKVIVVEDDMVTSPYFLNYMNEALDTYQDIPEVWHISGWNYPISPTGLNDVFLWRVMNCWGWATWSDRWKHFEKNINKIKSEFTSHDKLRFNLDGIEDFYNQINLNEKEKINTWAIFWYATIFKNNGLCVNPAITYIDNIGNDGSGDNCIDISTSTLKRELNSNKNIRFPLKLVESEIAVNKIKRYFKAQKKNIFFRAVNKTSRILLKSNLIK